jgi:hypothetical protein
MVFSHAAGRQMLTVSCSFPMPAETSVAAGRRRRCHRRRRRRGRAATVAPVAQAWATPTTPSITIPPVVSTPQLVIPMQSPETAPPPVKKLRKRRNEVELLRECGESNEQSSSPPHPVEAHLPPCHPHRLCPPRQLQAINLLSRRHHPTIHRQRLQSC